MFGESLIGKLAAVFCMSMVPVVELRGAIPLGVAAGLHPLAAAAAAVLGNMVPVPFILLLLRQVFALLRRVPWLGEKVEKYRLLGLMLLVAVPLPGTGAWTGALVAVMLDIRFRNALPAIALGVLAAGAVVTAATCGVAGLL